MSNRKYRLRRPMPLLKEGSIFEERNGAFVCNPYFFSTDEVEINKEWFEEVKEPEAPARISVSKVNAKNNSYGGMHCAFNLNTVVSAQRLWEIQRAIESVVNGEGIYSRIKYAKADTDAYDAPPLSRYIHDEMGQWASPKQFKWTDALVREMLQEFSKMFKGRMIWRREDEDKLIEIFKSKSGKQSRQGGGL